MNIDVGFAGTVYERHEWTCSMDEALGFITALLADTVRRAELYFRWGSDNGRRSPRVRQVNVT